MKNSKAAARPAKNGVPKKTRKYNKKSSAAQTPEQSTSGLVTGLAAMETVEVRPTKKSTKKADKKTAEKKKDTLPPAPPEWQSDVVEDKKLSATFDVDFDFNKQGATINSATGEFASPGQLSPGLPEQQQPARKRSSPIVVEIQNIGDGTRAVQLFNPEYKHEDIIIKSGMMGVTYTEMMRELIFKPFLVGETYMDVNTVDDGNNRVMRRFNRIMKVYSKNSDGTSVTIPIPLLMDPYQYQSKLAINNVGYRMDALTYLLLDIPADCKISLYLYPEKYI